VWERGKGIPTRRSRIGCISLTIIIARALNTELGGQDRRRETPIGAAGSGFFLGF
jgi:hypothetical protein